MIFYRILNYKDLIFKTVKIYFELKFIFRSKYNYKAID